MRLEYYAFAIIVVVAVLAIALPKDVSDDALLGSATHAQFSDFSAPEGRIKIQNQQFFIADSIVHKTAYFSVNGSPWQQFTLSGDSYNGDAFWLEGDTTYTLPENMSGPGEHYIITFSCTITSGLPNCHGNTAHPNGFWQLEVMNNTPVYPVLDGLLHWWSFDGDAQDKISSNHGVPSSGLNFERTDCKLNDCYSFTSNSDYITLQSPITLSTGTYSFWVKRDVHDDNYNLLASDPYKSRIYLSENGHLYVETNTNQEEFSFLGLYVPIGEWSHLLLSRDGDSTTLYRDGEFFATKTISGSSPLTISQIGFNGRSFRGSIDEVMIWDRALTSQEASEVYAFFSKTTSLTCASHAYAYCSDNDVYWYNSCDVREERRYDCTSNQACSGSSCIDEEPTPTPLSCGNKVIVYENNFEHNDLGMYERSVFDADWNTPPWSNRRDNARIVQDSSDSENPTNALMVTYPFYDDANGEPDGMGPSDGGGQWYAPLPDSYDELYLSYKIKYSSYFHGGLGGKIPGLSGGTNPVGCIGVSGTDGFSARMMFDYDSYRFYVYSADKTERCGNSQMWPGYEPEEGWHTVVQRVVMNDLNVPNGVIEGWYDGVLATQKDNYLFRAGTSSKFGIDTLMFSTFFGGSGTDRCTASHKECLVNPSDPASDIFRYSNGEAIYLWAPRKTEHAYFDDFVVYYYDSGANVTKGNVLSDSARSEVPPPVGNREVSACEEGSYVPPVNNDASSDAEIMYFNNFEQHGLGPYVNRSDDWTTLQFPNEGEDIYKDISDIENPSQVYRFFFPQGSLGLHTNNDPLGSNGFSLDYEWDEGWDEAYLTYKVKFEDGFDSANGGKLPRMGHNMLDYSTLGTLCPKDSIRYSGGMMFGKNDAFYPRFYITHKDKWNAPWWQQKFLEYNPGSSLPDSCLDMADGLGKTSPFVAESFIWDEEFESGKWYTITERLVANDVGVPNGVAEGFVNGRLSYRVTDLNFRDSSMRKFDHLSFRSHFGGDREMDASPKNQYIYFDDLLVYALGSDDVDVPHGSDEYWPSDKILIPPYPE